jgi:hypothetical protein
MRMKPFFATIFLIIALALCVEAIVPDLRRPMAIFSAICGFATWIVPVLVFVFTPRPRTSLGAVGFAISLFVWAAVISAMGLAFAFAALFLDVGVGCAHLGLITISAFWILVVACIAVGWRSGPVGRDSAS